MKPQQPFSAAEVSMPEIDAAFVNDFMKEINDISAINDRSTAHLHDKQNETGQRYGEANFPTQLTQQPQARQEEYY